MVQFRKKYVPGVRATEHIINKSLGITVALQKLMENFERNPNVAVFGEMAAHLDRITAPI